VWHTILRVWFWFHISHHYRHHHHQTFLWNRWKSIIGPHQKRVYSMLPAQQTRLSKDLSGIMKYKTFHTCYIWNVHIAQLVSKFIWIIPLLIKYHPLCTVATIVCVSLFLWTEEEKHPLLTALTLTLSWPAGHIFPTYKESFKVRWGNSIPLFLHAAIYLEVYLFRWTSQNAFSRETAVYKW
jgi:hypothetical protein